MPQPLDVVASFTHLTTNLPDWISEINKLSTYAAGKHADFAAEYSMLLKSANKNPKRVKSPSITSLHSTDEQLRKNSHSCTPGEDTTLPPLDLPTISPFEAGNKYLYVQARRKRKPTASVRSGASGPQKFRSKQSVVIYYDVALQKELDTMVKKIASARNNVRKGKMSRSLQKGLQLPTITRRFPDIYNSSAEDLGLPQVHSTKSLPIQTGITLAQAKPQADDSCFSQVDTELENAQSLCETAAHQFLRDGDCKLELDTVKAKFEAVLVLATDALAKLKVEKEAMEVQDATSTTSEATLCEEASQEPITTKLIPTVSPFSAAPTATLAGMGTAPIEVDDDDGSSIDVDITKFRSARAAGGGPGLRSVSGY